jgi:hypothetical protein
MKKFLLENLTPPFKLKYKSHMKQKDKQFKKVNHNPISIKGGVLSFIAKFSRFALKFR